jgi:hypothetical protein
MTGQPALYDVFLDDVIGDPQVFTLVAVAAFMEKLLRPDRALFGILIEQLIGSCGENSRFIGCLLNCLRVIDLADNLPGALLTVCFQPPSRPSSARSR